MGDFALSDSWSARLFDFASMPWRVSRRVLGQLDADAVLWPGDGLGHPLAPPLEALHASCVAGARLPGVGTSSRELANKLRAFSLFRWADRRLADTSSLADTERGLYDRLWLEEGAGHRLARSHGEDTFALRELLQQIGGSESYEVARNSGVGLALAVRALERQSEARGGEADRLGAFAEAVQAVCARRYRTAALENFGLAVRTLRPERLRAFGVRAAELGLAGPFWHGAGRGFYFAPTQLVDPPVGGSSWDAVSRLTLETPEAHRPDAVSGLAWALTLVNVRHPEVVGRRLRAYDRADCTSATKNAEAEWLAQGVASALMMWLGSTGRRTTADRFVDALPPNGLGRRVRVLLHREHATVEREGALAELFRYPGWDSGDRRRAGETSHVP